MPKEQYFRRVYFGDARDAIDVADGVRVVNTRVEEVRRATPPFHKEKTTTKKTHYEQEDAFGQWAMGNS